MKSAITVALGLTLAASAHAGITGIAQVPLLNINGTGSVKPNIMVLYDDSGSMNFQFTPDYVGNTTTDSPDICRGGTTLADSQRTCRAGDPPFNSSDVNRQYYNPAIRYLPPVDTNGTPYPDQDRAFTKAWTEVSSDYYGTNPQGLNGDPNESVTDLTTGFPDLKWCARGKRAGCQFNTTNDSYPTNTYYRANEFKANPYYYTLKTGEYCTDASLKTCRTGTVGVAPNGYPVPALVRWCDSVDLSNCQAKRTGSFVYPRFPATSGAFVRTDIVSTKTSYPKSAGRSDCAGSTCTYDEEMTNFANWYAYYKSRNQMMKTALGRAFQPVTSNYRVGIVGMRHANAVGIETPPDDFAGQVRSDWYDSLYAMTPNGGTPLRIALNAVGEMYAGKGKIDSPVQYPCQQNFVFLTTDGFWNGAAPGSGPDNNDNKEDPSRFCTKISGCVDTRDQSQPTLADVALYWYNGGGNTGMHSFLGPDKDDLSRPGQVPAGPGENTHVHMNTYALGLGIDGVMTYEPNYDKAPIVGGDFYKLITGVSSGCPWNNNGAYVWPDPQPSDPNDHQERVDDLWHAAINGHGKYFSAKDPQEVVNGLASALSNIQVRLGAAAAAATSTPNISQQDNDVFSDTFTTVKWYGELTDRKIDITTGVVGSDATWSSTDLLGRQVAAASDTRTIKMLDVTGGGLKDFKFSQMTGQEQGWFTNKCSTMAQCASLPVASRTIVDNGTALVDWLRGQQQYADDAVFRAYTKTSNTPAGASGPLPIVLGDIASAKPAYLHEPRRGYTLPGYSDFKVTWANRQATVFAAANDGMLHAFKADTGDEMWAYVPRITMKKLYRQASTTYGTNHQFTVDGSPEVDDVQIGGQWRTVLVGGLNGGGRGYYALDVTDPLHPKALWEVCADATICQRTDARYADFGLTFGNPQIGMWNGRWVVFVTSGYNNVPGADGVAGGSGEGFLYVLDIATGDILARVGTGSGDTGTPSGLARITAISNNPSTDPVVTFIYGGDNLGQLWRFDLSRADGSILASRLATSGTTQPITTRPDVTTCKVETKDTDGNVTSTDAKRVVLFGTGRLLDVPDVSDTDMQSLYLVKDGPTEVKPLRSSINMVQQNFSAVGQGAWTVTENPVDLSVKSGWFVDFDQNSGERVNLDPKIVGGTAAVVTNIPSSESACSVGGQSNVYTLNVCTGTWVDQSKVAGSVLSNTSAAVGFIIVRLPSGSLKMITTTADGKKITLGVSQAASYPTRKVGWRRVHN